MTIDATTRSRRIARALLLLPACMLAISVAVPTANAALASRTSTRYLTAQRSTEVLRAAFDGVAGQPIRESKVVVVPNSAATWALSDDVNIANQAWNPRAGRPWERSDAAQMWPQGMGGFTDPVTRTVYVNAANALVSHVPHELLHANASPQFLLTVGVAINEGVTEKMALDALATSHIVAERTPTYPKERAVAEAIMRVTGRDRVERAYFNGGADLASFVAALGPDTLERVRAATFAGDMDEALRIVG